MKSIWTLFKRSPRNWKLRSAQGSLYDLHSNLTGNKLSTTYLQRKFSIERSDVFPFKGKLYRVPKHKTNLVNCPRWKQRYFQRERDLKTLNDFLCLARRFRETLILLFQRLSTARSGLVYFSFAFQRERRERVSIIPLLAGPPPLSSVRGKRFFPQFPRDCLLRKFSTPIDCPLLGQIIFIIFLGARPLVMGATLWPPWSETRLTPRTALHLLAVNFY